jgi:hypothetical protein
VGAEEPLVAGAIQLIGGLHHRGREDIKRLVAGFNRDWPDVSRGCEIVVLAEEFGS